MRRFSLSLFCTVCFALAVTGCKGKGDPDPEITDADSDGIFAADDCDDTNAAIFPGAPEVCDGFDNNCDGQIDEESTTTYYADLDGDGFGDPDNPTEACSQPSGYTDDVDDCDDGDASTHPGADELCDNQDHDCNGDPQEDAVDAPEWFLDGDGDGFGNALISEVGCSGPSGYVAQGTDCNDNNLLAYPGQSEFCNGIDDNCDGIVDEDTAVDVVDWFPDLDNDGHGDPAAGFAACEAPPGAIALGDDCDDTDAAISPDGVEVCDGGIDNDCDPATDEEVVDAVVWFTDDDDDGFGRFPSVGQACDKPAFAADNDTDCDDNDADISPGADELCNGVDDNCDGDIDVNASDAQIWYVDSDGDGFGDSMTAQVSCTQPSNSTNDATDCDDSDPEVYPGAPERCNGGIDDDCDVFTFDDDSPDALVWYVDADNDGHGTSLEPTVLACTLPLGYADVDDDCNDANGTIFPGANELCDGGVDNDCDPLTDEADTAMWFFDGDGDGWGVDFPNSNGCSPPTGYTQLNGDCDDADPAVNPGVAPSCIQNHCGTIPFDETWIAPYVHVITCDVLIQGPARPVVTINDGAEVRFQAGTSLVVGAADFGTLNVNGIATGVRFTSDAVAPAPGDWGGLNIQSNDQGSVLDGLEIEYAGGNMQGALWISNAAPTVTNVTIHDNIFDGVHIEGGFPDINSSVIRDNSGDGVEIDANGGLALGTFVNNSITSNGEEPVVIPARYVAELDLSNTFAGNGTDEIAILGDTVDASGTWNTLDVPYRIDGDVLVEGAVRPALILSDGATVGFSAGTALTAGVNADGSLVVDGSALGVLFTSAAAIPVAGDWGGLELGPNDQGSTLEGLTVEFAGGNGFGGIYANGSSPTLTGVSSRSNLRNGFYGTGSTATITGSTFFNNFEKGVYLDATSSLAPPFANNTLTGNQEEPLWMEAASAHLLDQTTTFTGNAIDEIALIGGLINGLLDSDRSWLPMDVPYRADGTLYLHDLTSPTWTVAQGVEVRFVAGTGIEVGTASSGRIDIQGTALNEVRFTSAAAVPSPGDWNGLELGTLDAGSTLTGLTVAYAGANGQGAVHADNASPVIVDSVLRDSLYAGFSGVGAVLDMSGSTVFNNAGPGITLDDDSELADDIAGPTFTDNTLAANLTWAIEMNASSVDELDPSSSFIGNGNNPIRLRGDTLDADVTFRLQDSPYQIFESDLIVGGPVGPTVTVDDGVLVEFESALNFLVATSAPGRLLVNGTFVGVTFTSAQPVKAPGDWGGLEISSFDQGSILTGLTIAFAGGNGRGGLYVNGSSPSMIGGALVNNAGVGFYGENAAASLDGVTISGNANGGVWLDGNSTIAGFSNNTITGNGGEPVTVSASEANGLDATTIFNGNGVDVVVLTADTIDQPVTWADLGVPYQVTGDVTVEGGPTAILTVADGTIVMFDTNAGILVGDGGTPGQLNTLGAVTGVTFTSSQTLPSGGDWDGVTLGASDLGSSLLGLTVEYGGGNGEGNVFIRDCAPTLDGVVAADSTEHGVSVTGLTARPEIVNSVLRDNDRDGLFVSSNSGLDENNTPGFTGNLITSNGSNALTLPGRYVKELDNSSSYAGNVGPIVLTADVLDVDATMQALDEVFQIAGDLDVQDASGPTLTVEDGVTALFGPSVELSAGVSDSGMIDVQGGVGGVVFSSDQAIPAPGDWDGIQLGANDIGSQLAGLTIEYAGDNGRGGLFLNLAPAPVLVDASTLTDNNNSGIYSAGGTLELRNSTISNSSSDGVWLDRNSTLVDGLDNTFNNNVITGNDGQPLVVDIESVEEIDPSSTFTGNTDDRIGLWSGTVSSDTVMHGQDVPYLLVGGDWIVQGISDPVMTVEDGAIVQFEAARNLVVANTATGQLRVDGLLTGVLFTSAEPIPAPGDWGGVTIGAADTGSVLVGLTIEYGGSNGFGGLYANGSSPTIIGGALQFNQGAGFYGASATLDMTGTTISGNTTDGVFLNSASSVAAFSGNTITGNLANAFTAPAALADGLDDSTTYTGNGVDQVVLTTDIIDSGAIWRDLGVPLRVTGDVTVAGGPAAVLTVEDGVTAQFDGGAEIFVAMSSLGMIDVQGTATGVLFTSSQVVPVGGDWRGLQIGASDMGSTLTGLTIEYAGANNLGNLVFAGSSPTLTNVASRESTSSGLRISGATARPTITGSVFSDNDEDGIYLTSEAGLDESVTPSFAGNTLNGNGEHPIVLPARFVKELAASSSFAGNPSPILVTPDNIDVDSTWRALDSGYEISGDVTVADATGPLLTIDDAVTVLFDANAGLSIGVANSGQLALNGGATGIVLTSAAMGPAPGDWDGVRIASNDLGSSVVGTTIEFGGNNGNGGLWLNAAPNPVIVQNATITNNANAGIFATNTLVTIENTAVTQNTGDGVYLDSLSRLEPSTQLINTFQGNTLTGNGGYPMVVSAASIDELDASSSFAGNFSDIIRVWGTTTTESQTLHLVDAEYEVFNADWIVAGLGAPVLTVEDAVTVRFDTARDLIVASTEPGALMVNGTLTGVLFTSAQPVPNPGDWGGVRIGSNDTGSVLVGLTIEYAGSNGFGGLFADRSSPTLIGGALLNNQGAGYYGTSASADITNTTISGNTEEGVFLDAGSDIDAFAGNTITGNGGNAVTTTADNADLLDGTSSYGGNGVNAVFLTAATIADPVTWADLGVPYRIMGDVSVSGGPTAILTVADGVYAEFETGTDILVATAGFPGLIDVQGAVTGVTFTSAQTLPARGDWGGIQVGVSDAGSSFLGLDIAYGGGNGYGNLYLNGSSPSVDGVFSHESTRSGLYATGAASQPLIVNSSFEDNDEQGVSIAASAGLDESAPPGFVNNTMVNNGGSPIILPARFLNELDASSSFAGNGALINVLADTIDIDVTWPLLDEDYQVTGNIIVSGAGSPILTVEDGVLAQFGAAVTLDVGLPSTGSLDVQGGLLGTTFTSDGVLPAPGDWNGVHFGINDVGSTLTNLTVEFAGNNGRGGVWAASSDPVLDGCVLANNLNDGLNGTSAFPEIRNTISTLNTADGVYLDQNSRLAIGVDDTFSGNLLTGNAGYPLVVSALSIDEISDTSSYTGNGIDYVRLWGGTLTTNATMQALDADYELFNADFVVRGAATPVLTIEDGVRLDFATGRDFIIANTTPGVLIVAGGLNGVTFSSSDAAPFPGSWGGVQIGSQDAGSSLTNLTIEYGGENGFGGLYVNGGAPALSGVALTNNLNDGASVRSGTLDMVGSSATGNTTDGVYLDGTSSVANFGGNTLTGNAGYPMVLNVEDVDAIDGGTTYAGNGLDTVYVRGGTLDTDAEWEALDVPYRLFNADLIVRGPTAPTWTVDDGVTIEFEALLDVIIADTDLGRMVVDGNLSGVLFTSAAPVPAEGDWGGVKIGVNDTGTTILGLTIEYAGANGFGGLYADRSSPSITGSTFRNNAGAGYYGVGATADLAGCVFANNSGEGVFLDTNSGIATLANSTVDNNDGNAITVPARYAGDVAITNVLTNNGLNEIQVTGDTIDASVTWSDVGVPYHVLAGEDIIVEGGPAAVWTVLDGVVVNFGAGCDVRVATGATAGRLNLAGGLAGILFSSDQAVPTRGDWGGVEIGMSDSGSALTNSIIEYAGSNGTGNIRVVSSAPTLIGVTSRESTESGVYVTGATAEPLIQDSNLVSNDVDGLLVAAGSGIDRSAVANFTGNTMTNNGANPVTVPADFVGQLDASSTFAGNAFTINVTTDEVETTQTWQALDVVYRVSGNVDVEGPLNPALTIADGVVIEFEASTDMTVGQGLDDGVLLVDGTGSGVLFTSAAALPTSGDWRGLEIGGSGDGTILDGLTIEYAGDNGNGGIWINDAGSHHVTVRNSVARLSSRSGLKQSGGVTLIHDSTFTANADHGVEVTGGVLDNALPPSFVGNTLTGNVRSSVKLLAESVSQLDASSTYVGNGTDIEISGGTVLSTGIWQLLDADYWVSAPVDIEGALDPVLTVSSGVTLYMEDNIDFDVGVGDDGGLVVDGSTGSVTFTSASALPGPGSWHGVEFGPNQFGSHIDRLVIEYGGGNTFGNLYFRALNPNGTMVEVTNTISQLSSRAGLYANNSTVWVHDSVFTANNDQGLELVNNSALDDFATPSFTNNVVTTNGGYPMWMHPSSIGQLDASSTFVGNFDDRIAIITGFASEDATWQGLDVPLLVLGNLDIEGPSSPHVDIEAGATLQFDENVALRVGRTDIGSLSVAGAPGTPVTFTSSDVATPLPGDWAGITLYNQCNPLLTVIDNAVIEYGGSNSYGNVEFNLCDATISTSTVRNSSTYGLYRSGAAPTILGITYGGNTLGDLF